LKHIGKRKVTEMIITKRGDPKTHKPWKGHCRICGSEAEAIEAELTNFIGFGYSEQGRYYFAWEKCPICGAWDIGKDEGMFFINKVHPGI
jgi:ribosomal protein L37E